MMLDLATTSMPKAEKLTPDGGMTTKVVRGALWTFLGHIAPLGVSFATTPMVIRLLGVESYGILILVGLIPNYFLFADFGMSIASTKFAAVAYAERDTKREGHLIYIAALITIVTSMPIALCIFFFSNLILTLFKVPEHLRDEASLALKLASFTFVINLLCGVFNTPQLIRLRMDLNTYINAGTRIVGYIATPIMISTGFGIVGGVAVLLMVSLISLMSHLFVFRTLLSDLSYRSIDRSIIRPLLKYGGALATAGVASVLLVNAEKGILAATVSTNSLAYYSVAFTLATVAMMPSSAMSHSLIPAFSQLLLPDKRVELESLSGRSLRLNMIGLVPGIIFLFIIARPFFTTWAGKEFGDESTLVFYCLLGGLSVNLPACIPYCILMALGKATTIAALYWSELVPYLILIFTLTKHYGVIGAAIAWSVRMLIDGLIFFWLAKRESTTKLSIIRLSDCSVLFLLLPFSPAMLLAFVFESRAVWVMCAFLSGSIVYSLIVWRKLLQGGERAWLEKRFLTAFRG